MKLYHGTTIEFAENIKENGFEFTDNDGSRCDREYQGECIYGFDNYDDAEGFILNQGQDTMAVVCFDVDDEHCISDAEYGDGAYIVTEIPKSVEIVWTQG